MVHVGGKLPPAYDDATLRAIQDSRGGVSTEIPEVMQRLATQAALGDSAVSVVDGYAWSMDKQPQEASLQADTTSQNGFEPVAARQLVLGLSKEKAKEQLIQLDTMHAVAKSSEIVTPYSSMIVLVNDQQREALKRAEQQSDRFDRKVENGNEQLTKPVQSSQRFRRSRTGRMDAVGYGCDRACVHQQASATYFNDTKNSASLNNRQACSLSYLMHTPHGRGTILSCPYK
jgi:putative PEP-CTERM system integral membrane protein